MREGLFSRGKLITVVTWGLRLVSRCGNKWHVILCVNARRENHMGAVQVQVA